MKKAVTFIESVVNLLLKGNHAEKESCISQQSEWSELKWSGCMNT